MCPKHRNTLPHCIQSPCSPFCSHFSTNILPELHNISLISSLCIFVQHYLSHFVLDNFAAGQRNKLFLVTNGYDFSCWSAGWLTAERPPSRKCLVRRSPWSHTNGSRSHQTISQDISIVVGIAFITNISHHCFKKLQNDFKENCFASILLIREIIWLIQQIHIRKSSIYITNSYLFLIFYNY